MNRAEAMQNAIKLLRLATSDNPHEAALAAQRAQEILDRFEITQAMLEDTQTSHEPEEIENFEEKQAPLDQFGMQIELWKSYLSSVIAATNACCVFSQRKQNIGFPRQRSFLHIVGRPSDVEKVRYLYGYLVGETGRLCDRHGRGCGRTWMNQFRLGVVDTLAERLREGHEQLVATMRKAGTASIAGSCLVRRGRPLMESGQRFSTMCFLCINYRNSVIYVGNVSLPGPSIPAKDRG